MRLQGSIDDVKAIESMIKRREHEILHDGGGEGIFAIVLGNNGNKSSVFTRVFKVYLPNGAVQIGLYYDKRNNIGIVRGRDEQFLRLVSKVRGIGARCAKMKPIHNHNRRSAR